MGSSRVGQPRAGLQWGCRTWGHGAGDAHAVPQQQWGLGAGGGGCSSGAGEGLLPALCAATTTHAAARGPCCSPLPGSERHREQSRGGERAARCGAQAPGLQRERWERGSRTSSGVSPTWKEPQALRGLLGQPKRFLVFELRCRAAALKKNKSHFLQHGSSCCSICCAGRGWEGAQVPLRERRNRSRGRGLRAAKHNAAPRSRVKTLFPKTNPKKPKRRPVSDHYITVAAFSSS